MHVRRAFRGDNDSLAWLVTRFTPALLCHARWCLGKGVSRFYDPEDLVHETWAVALPKLPALVPGGSRSTPTLVSFLGTTLVQIANRWITKHIVRRKEGGSAPEDGEFDRLAAETRGVITSVMHRERQGQVAHAIEQLSETDRTIVILRGLEGCPAREVAAIVSLSENAVHLRFSRTLRRLRELLPGSLFADIDPE